MNRPGIGNPLAWLAIQIVEFIVVLLLLSRVVPGSWPRWLGIVLFVAAIVVIFIVNMRWLMPWLDRAGSGTDTNEPGR
jgi:uncharacterized membrane protein YphA (DoxX/SURF4 family)